MKRSVPTTKPTAGDGEHGDGDAHKTPAPSSGDEAINPQTELAVLAPFGTAPNECPARPMRCKKVAIERGVPSWQTRSM